ncbi:hypothetical protein GIB67_012412 [Kingdonia uniflora]|uniref:Uncharacterized protein n=1 Tax=Kingdonia uniflora TaxID=39325 RepID=A0A7J7LLW7_9MAGN|nr:hypothetical protein GIB67_012412 [Kingdonia uniflora]
MRWKSYLNLKSVKRKTKLKEFKTDDSEWFEKLEWDDQSVKAQLQQQLLPEKEYKEE